MTTHPELREAFARVIDPGAFKCWQVMFDNCIERMADSPDAAKSYADLVYKDRCDAARAKADQCLALLPEPEGQDGGVVVSDAMVDRALKARVPGGSEVWVWLPQHDENTPSETAKDVMRCALEAALATLSPAETGWRTIETAPRDGTWFLACATTHGWGATRIVRFAYPDDRLPIHGEGGVWPSAPTHWQPLPPAPSPATLAASPSPEGKG